MKQKFIPANRPTASAHHEIKTIKFHVCYKEKHVGMDSEFDMAALNAAHLVQILIAMFPGRGDFTFSEVQE